MVGPQSVLQYLGRLIAAATTAVNAEHHAAAIADLKRRRELASLAHDSDEPGILAEIPPGKQVSIEREIFPVLAEQGSLSSDMVETIKDQVEQSIKDSGRLSSIFGSLFVALIVYPIFAILGALLGFAIFKPKTPPQATVTH